MTLRGIDLSGWQTKTPDLTGYAFAIIRASYGSWPDKRYQLHEQNVRAAGLPVGAYTYGVRGDGAQQARTLLSVAPNADFYALDWEANGGATMTAPQASAFIRAIEASGRQCGLYHSKSGFVRLGENWDWVASWDGIPPPAGWTFHQYRGSPLDLDEFNGDAAAFASFLATQRIAVTKNSLTPAAAPALWTGFITSALLAALQYATGHGILTGNQAAGLTPQVAIIANGIATLLPTLFSLVTHQVTVPKNQVAAPAPAPLPASVPVAPAPAPSLPVPSSPGVSPVAIDLTSPSNDTPTLLRQWLAVYKDPSLAQQSGSDPMFQDAEEAKSQIVQLTANIVAMGTAYSFKPGDVTPSLLRLAQRLNAGNTYRLTAIFEAALVTGQPTFARTYNLPSLPIVAATGAGSA